MIKTKAYTLATKDDTAELTLYGDIVETRPVDFWTGEPIDGDFIMLDQFLEDLDTVKGKKTLTIRLNSYGGDAGVSNMIHNRLRELQANGTALTCVVDGVAMSGGSLIMCACDTVKAYPSSLIMIHKCWSLVFGTYNADELRDMAKTQDAWDGAQTEIYQRKTGLSKAVLTHMMADTTYMTGREAKDKGFVDELLEEADATPIAASANGTAIFARGRWHRLPPGVFAPDRFPTAETEPEAEPATEAQATTVTPAEADDNTPETEVTPMTLEELREQYPDLLQSVEAEAKASATAAAAEAERARVAAIDEIAHLYTAEQVQEAKYGNPCTAQEMAYRAAKEAAAKGQKFLTDLQADANESGSAQVGATPPPAESADPVADAKAAARAFLNSKKKEVH